MKTPSVDNHEFYDKDYSIPVLALNTEGKLLTFLVRYHYATEGWVEATWRDGPYPSDYDFTVSSWEEPMKLFGKE